MELTIGSKTIPTSFFVISSHSAYNVLLGWDWILATCYIPSTMHQLLIQWNRDNVEVVPVDDSSEISLTDMNAWNKDEQEPISRMTLEGYDHVEATKIRLRLILFAGLTE